MPERSCTTCVFSDAPSGSTVCSTCSYNLALPNYKPKMGIPIVEQKQEVTFDAGRYGGGDIYAPDEPQLTFDESRADNIGQNGNEGLHYDNVQKPKHYQLLPGVEVIDIRRALLAKVDQMPVRPSGFAVNCWDRALEYTIRAWEKNGVEDLEKAVTYLQHAIRELKG